MSSVDMEYCDAFMSENANFWMRIEHCGRYLWASDYLVAKGAKSVLDVACATGYGSDLIAKRGIMVTGVDRRSDCISCAIEHYSDNGALYRRLDLDEEDWTKAVSTVDAVTCFETLEHVRNPARLVSQLSSVLVPRGTLLLSVPNVIFERFDESGNNKDPFHLHTFNREVIVTLLHNACFSIDEELGQDICNRAIRISSDLTDAGVPIEVMESLWNGAKSRDSMLLASRVLGYPTDFAVSYSYSFVFACSKISV